MLAPPAIVELVGSLARDVHGISFLANALDSVEAELVDESLVRDLLCDLVDEIASDPGSRWADALSRICSGKASPSRRPGGYLRAARAKSSNTHTGSIWMTVVSAAVWKDKHLDTSKKRATPLPPFPPAPDAIFQRQFEVIVAEPDWYQPPTPAGGAWLGRPALEGANCWVSCGDLDAGFKVPAKSQNGSARRVLEALGILPKSPFDHYVRYSIDPATARSSVGGDVQRPCFADQGNEWFRVATMSPRAKHYSDHGWGTTVNLSATRVGRTDDTGRPERVSASIPLGPAVRGLEILYPRPGDRRFASAPTQHFKQTLMRERSETDIESAVLKLWNIVPPPSL